MRSRRSLKLSHTQTSVPCGTLNKLGRYSNLDVETLDETLHAETSWAVVTCVLHTTVIYFSLP